MYAFEDHNIGELVQLAKGAYPREASGLLFKRRVRGYTLLSFVGTSCEDNTPLSFRITDAAIDGVVQSLGASNAELCGVGHSHTIGPSRLSLQDQSAAKARGDLWLIYSLRFKTLALFEWSGGAFRRRRFRITRRRRRRFN